MSDKLHEAVAICKRLYFEEGITPSRRRLSESGVSKYILDKYAMFRILEMAGIKEIAINATEVKKITNEIFNKDLSSHLESYTPNQLKPHPKWSKILALGDVHFPFHNKECLERAYSYAEYFKPDYIIQLGDLLDFYSFSKYPRSHNEFTPKEEVRLGREGASEMWLRLKKASPSSKCYQILGNHCVRPVKRTMETMPEMEDWIKGYFKELFTFDGVNTIYDIREELVIDEILFTHGFLGKEGAHRDYFMRNVVFGHLHKLWVQYRRLHNQQFFEACAGFLGDPDSKGLSYTPTKTANYQLGILSIDQFGPRPIHF